MNKTTQFKRLVFDKEILTIPIAHDPLCAKIIERAGFQALASGGLACDAIRMGVPDTGLLTLTEMVSSIMKVDTNYYDGWTPRSVATPEPY